MANIPWRGLGPYYSTGYIDIDQNGNIQFPSIPGQSDIATFVDYGNLSTFFGNTQNAALDHVATIAVLGAACQIGSLVSGPVGPLVDAAWNAAGGLLLGLRVTCEGVNHVLGIPTAFVYHFYILHDQLALFTVAAIIAGIVFIALCQTCTYRIVELIKAIESAPIQALGQQLILWAIAGAGLALAVYAIEKKIALPGQEPQLPAPPPITGVPTPTPNVSTGINLGPVSSSAGIGGGGGGGGQGTSRRRR